MADLLVDFDVLERVRGNLDRIDAVLHGPCNVLKHFPADAAGDPVLRDRLHDFASTWDFGIKQLAEFSSEVGDALQSVVSTFRELDAELARALRS